MFEYTRCDQKTLILANLFGYLLTVFSVASILRSLSRSAFAADVGSPPAKKADLLLDFHFISLLESGQSFRKENPLSRMSTVLPQPKKSIFNVLWACASWHSGRQQSSARLLWIFSPQIPQDFRVDSLTLFRPTVSMLHNPYSYSHSFQVSLEPKFTFAYCTSLGSMMKLQTSQHKRSESIFQGVVWKQQLCCQRTCCILFLIIPCMFTDNTLEKKMVCHMVPFS